MDENYIKDYRIERDGKLYFYSEIRFLVGRVEWKDTMAQDLFRWGMIYKNTNEDKRIKTPFIPKLSNQKLMYAFLLGFYDGDGSLRSHKSPKGRIKVSPQIGSSNYNFMEQIKQYYNIQNSILLRNKEVFDYKSGEIKTLNMYYLTIGSDLLKKMMNLMKNSMERKRISPQMNYLTAQREWLLTVLPKEKFEKIIKVQSPYKIAKALNLSPSVISRFAKNILNLKIPKNQEKNNQNLKFWKEYLELAGKYKNE